MCVRTVLRMARSWSKTPSSVVSPLCAANGTEVPVLRSTGVAQLNRARVTVAMRVDLWNIAEYDVMYNLTPRECGVVRVSMMRKRRSPAAYLYVSLRMRMP